MEIRSENINGDLKAVLYTDSGEFIKVLEEDAQGIKIPHFLMEKLRDNALEKLEEIVDPEDDMEEIDDQIAVNLNRRAMGNINTPKANYVENNDPQSRSKSSKPPPKPSMFLGKPQEEKYSDYRRVKTPPSIVKSLLGHLGLNNILFNHDKEQQELIRYEMERGERMSRRNRKRNK